VPLVYEALATALDGIAEVRGFPAHRGDTSGLLYALSPDGVVVDASDEAREAEAYARGSNVTLVHVQLTRQKLRVLVDGEWEESQADTSPESIRNILAGRIFGHAGAGR
jgi:hypothetical protein